MTELKPCPFCGEQVYLEKVPMWSSHNGITHGYHGCYEFDVHCRNKKCGCRINISKNDTIYNSEDEARRNAIKAWNRRYIETFQNICRKCSKQHFCKSRTDETIGCSAFSSGVVWTEDAIRNEPKSYTTWASTDEPQTERNESKPKTAYYCEDCKHICVPFNKWPCVDCCEGDRKEEESNG